MTAAKASLETCTECHGADYTGGISKIACTDCHIGNQQSIHPTQWGPFGFILHADYVRTNTSSTCANALCHGANLDGAGGTGPSCTSCHMGDVASMHPPWGTPDYAKHGSYVKSNNNDTSGCANARCHGTNLDGIGGAGPSCTSCHMGGANSIHPTYWGSLTYAMHGSYVKSNDTSGCANVSCHGTTLTGVSGSGPSCTLCHIGGVASVHPAEWNGNIKLHKTYNDFNSCRNIVCHGDDFNGVYLSGPSCYLCH
ncbi:MAG: hypothetical protein Q8O44_03920 [Syntrophales bacterium]|nr:hypothetical protein [Syntrophales bacterium]